MMQTLLASYTHAFLLSIPCAHTQRMPSFSHLFHRIYYYCKGYRLFRFILGDIRTHINRSDLLVRLNESAVVEYYKLVNKTKVK